MRQSAYVTVEDGHLHVYLFSKSFQRENIQQKGSIQSYFSPHKLISSKSNLFSKQS